MFGDDIRFRVDFLVCGGYDFYNPQPVNVGGSEAYYSCVLWMKLLNKVAQKWRSL